MTPKTISRIRAVWAHFRGTSESRPENPEATRILNEYRRRKTASQATTPTATPTARQLARYGNREGSHTITGPSGANDGYVHASAPRDPIAEVEHLVAAIREDDPSLSLAEARRQLFTEDDDLRLAYVREFNRRARR
jgi:hypothetical protein